MLVLHVDRLGDGFGEKGQAEELILKHRNEILTDLLFQLQDYVRIWRDSKEDKTSLRVAAFGLAVTRFSRLDGGKEKAELIFQKLRRSQGDLLSDHNSLFTAMDVRELTNTKVSAVGMGRKLSALKPLLQQRYGMTHNDGKKGSTIYTFSRPVADGEKQEDAQVSTTVELTEAIAWVSTWIGGDG
jgi:hypothetical protein